MKRTIILVVFLSLSLFVAVWGYQKLDTATKQATLHLEKSLLQARAKEILRQEDEQTKKVQAVFFRKDVMSEINAQVFTAYGDIRLLIQGMSTLSEEDKEGCLISSALATEVFKSTNVAGNHIKLEDEEYIIREVYHSANKELIRLGLSEEDNFTQVRVQRHENELVGKTLQEFVVRYGLLGTPLQWVEFVGLVKGLLLIALGSLMTIPWYFIRKVLPIKIKIPTKIGFLQEINISSKIVLAMYIVIIAMIIGSQVKIPIEMMPAKISDFGYWAKCFDDTCKNIGNIFLLEKVGYEQGFLLGGIWSITSSLVVIITSSVIFINNR